MAGEDGRDSVVVGVDGSNKARLAVRWAAERAAERSLPLHVVYGYGLVARYFATEAPVPPSVIETLLEEAQTLVESAADEATEVAPGLAVSVEAVDEPPVPALTHRSRKAALVVLGASGLGGFTGMLAGSTAVAVAAHAHAPVVVVRCGEGRTEPPSTGPIVVGMDGSSLSDRAVACAFDEAQRRSAPLVAVHAWADVEDESVLRRARMFFTNSPEEKDVRAELDAQLGDWQAKYPDVEVERVLVRDRPRRQLLDRSETAQLVVVGSRGRGGFRGLLLGSTSQALIHHAQCPVMVVRPPKGDEG
ncbi:universal stress protein [Saccharomonospora azurea]|uniref:Universal stress protein UspA-like protein n=1 Tax=Saccharomonospora azurea NA-128 TaxID=882081 RepID=H8GEF2_9PSEU|nr:universal stress protein [Saccharomonospora azurea]EHY87947.1 universal stress protein UspA-like protein [Saccharomonospora azurea NA-128]